MPRVENRTAFADGKAPDALRTIGEVEAALGIRAHVLRYWEDHVPALKPLKRAGGRRLYRPEDIATLVRLDELINRRGYTLKGAKAALRDAEGETVSGRDAGLPDVRTEGGKLDRLKSIRKQLAEVLAALPT